jgi:pyruvate ferredoxin oxidoreductase beta subunit
VAQTTPYHWKDLATKVQKALSVDGPAFMNILAPCTIGWHFETELTMQIAKEATETNFWPLFEVENGRYTINYKPKERQPIRGWLEQQGRFKHLFKPGNEAMIEEMQLWVDDEWEKLLRLEAKDAAPAEPTTEAAGAPA